MKKFSLSRIVRPSLVRFFAMSTKEKKKNSFSLPINPQKKVRNKRTSAEPNFSAGGRWKGLLGADPASLQRRESSLAEIVPDGDSDGDEVVDDVQITVEQAAERNVDCLRKMLINSHIREGDRILHAAKFESILFDSFSKIRTVMREYGDTVGTAGIHKICQIMDDAERDASEV